MSLQPDLLILPRCMCIWKLCGLSDCLVNQRKYLAVTHAVWVGLDPYQAGCSLQVASVVHVTLGHKVRMVCQAARKGRW